MNLKAPDDGFKANYGVYEAIYNHGKWRLQCPVAQRVYGQDESNLKAYLFSYT